MGHILLVEHHRHPALIHSLRYLYNASFGSLLRTDPDSGKPKKGSFKARVEFVGVNPGEKSHCNGSPFQTEGPTTGNAPIRQVEVRGKSLGRRPVDNYVGD